MILKSRFLRIKKTELEASLLPENLALADSISTFDLYLQHPREAEASIPLVKQLMPSPERKSESSTRTSQPELALADQKTSLVWSKLELECEFGTSVAMFNTRGVINISRASIKAVLPIILNLSSGFSDKEEASNLLVDC
ncbi:hypothetical protein M0R45_004780 [Rubus argutus]|uniref:Uncharacterized protein n=1 Tax=Rubus argutus TaxID=59490 RepID=A0AAW1YKU6_RUBAR